ncbi:MAG: hypothetical protein ACTSRZ_04305 [Promethearchaeota archaeon]
MESHVPPTRRNDFIIIVCDYEIEEWICDCLEINYGENERKPSRMLAEHCRRQNPKKGYYKSNLQNFAKKINFDELERRNRSFREFLNALIPS